MLGTFLKLLLKHDFPRIWVPHLGEPRSPAIAVAPPPHAAGADAGHESTAGRRAERRPAPLSVQFETSREHLAHSVVEMTVN
jgi:hypothetical protein